MPRLFSADAAPSRSPASMNSLPRRVERPFGFLRITLVVVAPSFEQSRPRDQQLRAGLLGALHRALKGGQLMGKIAEGGKGFGLGQVDARVVVLWRRGAPQLGDGGQRILIAAGGGLGGGQPQSVLDVVGEETPQRPVHVDGLRRVALHLVQTSFDVEPVLARQRSGRVEGLLCGFLRTAVIAERRPRGSERGLDHRIARLARGGLSKQGLRLDGVEQPEPRESLRVEARRLEALRERRSRPVGGVGGAGLQAEPRAKLAAGVGHHRKEPRFLADA